MPTENTKCDNLLVRSDMNKSVKEYLAKIGAKGGKKSKRALTADQARAMVKAREDKKLKKTSQIAQPRT